jgi:hemoglobin/transferrin/lactoferrin receptor protein
MSLSVLDLLGLVVEPPYWQFARAGRSTVRETVRVLATTLGVLTLTSSALAQQGSGPFVGRVVDEQSKKPVSGALISIAGFPGSAKTDADGNFTWEPRPATPFQVIVVLPSGQVAKPVLIEKVDGPATIPVNALADESVTVVGAAPSIEATPAAGTTLLSQLQIARRSPEHLLQALETVPGVNQVSEGHASVPAIRGMARGRTLILIDGARVTSERRVGASATFMDPSVLEGVDVARGPGSVAYGSDALGGVIAVRTRRAEPGSPFRIRANGTLGGGIPDRRGTVEVSKGLSKGGFLAQAHVRRADDYDSPEDDAEIFNSGWKDQGFLARFDHELGAGVFSAGWQSDYARDVERPRNNSTTVRFYYPYENSHRFTTSYELAKKAGFQQLVLTGFLGTFSQRTDQDRFATATTGRSIERADIDAKDFHVKGSGQRSIGKARLEVGLDINGRFGLEAFDIIQRYDLSGALTSETINESIDNAWRTDVGAYAQVEMAVTPVVWLSGGIRGDHVGTENNGGFFGDRSTSNGAFSGFAATTIGPFSGFSITGQASRGFRDPTLSDRYFRGPSGRGFITGNPDLEPETSLQFDVAARYTMARTQLAFFYYHYRIDDLIERFSPQTDFFFFRNRGRGIIKGFEVETHTDLGRGYSLEIGGQVGRGELDDDGSNLDDISPDSLLMLFRKDFGDRAFGQIRMALLDNDARPGPSEVDAPGATIFDLAGGWRFTRNLELRGAVRNLLDDSYYASPDPRWVWAAGRSASLTFAVQF